jgi:hypothetical protein
MNERIQQLWTQAEEEIKAEYEDESRRNRRLYNEIFLPKFAELIVAECLGIVHNAERGGSNEIWDNAVKFIRRDLQEHFGVEE